MILASARTDIPIIGEGERLSYYLRRIVAIIFTQRLLSLL